MTAEPGKLNHVRSADLREDLKTKSRTCVFFVRKEPIAG